MKKLNFLAVFFTRFSFVQTFLREDEPCMTLFEGRLIIGSRGSDLALWQANYLQSQLLSIGIQSEIKIIKTRGDVIQHVSLSKVEGVGFFTKEIEEALLKREIDIAVHSYKDLPTAMTKGLTIAAVSGREDASELLLINPEAVDIAGRFSLKKNAVVGTSSPRRKAQLLALRPDLKLEDLRGNVPTRVQKLRDKKYDAILVAYAGINRLNLNLKGLHVEKISPQRIIPAPAQGVLAYQIREEDEELKRELQKIHHPEVAETIGVERRALQLFQGGCQIPVGVYCEKKGGNFLVWAVKADDWNKSPQRIFLQSGSVSGLAETAVQKIKKVQPKSVFITTDLNEESYFGRILMANSYSVFAESLIEFSAVSFDRNIPQVDWIFFSSRNGVKFFFSSNPILPKNVRFAVMGEGTAAALKQFGYAPNLQGSPQRIYPLADFQNLAGLILFPQARNSLRSIQQQLSLSAKAIDLIVYDNVPKKNFDVPETDILVLTSPMNATVYFSRYSLNTNQKIIAIGKTTGKKLKELGINNYILPYDSDEIALADAVMSLE